MEGVAAVMVGIHNKLKKALGEQKVNLSAEDIMALIAMKDAPLARLEVTSSNIKTVGYDTSAKVLEVEFGPGSIYRYLNVSNEDYTKLMAAPSVGRALNTDIKPKYSVIKFSA